MLPPDVTALAEAHRIRQQRLTLLATREAGKVWGRLDAQAVRASWERLVGSLLRMVIAAQSSATDGAQDYVAAALSMQGAAPEPFGTVNARPLVGVASDGRDLRSLLTYPAHTVEDLLSGGMNRGLAVGRGLLQLQRIVSTQVGDAARVSTGLATINDRRTRGYIRHLTPPSCSRCVILAGKFYRTNQGFQRHPHCDCVHIPSAEVIEPQSPRDLFDAMSDAELRKAGWSQGDIQAIRDGADIYQVTNARKGLRSVTVAGRQVQATTEGTTRRGLAGMRLGAQRGQRAVRLTPEQIYADAQHFGLSREQTLDVLKRHGYIL